MAIPTMGKKILQNVDLRKVEIQLYKCPKREPPVLPCVRTRRGQGTGTATGNWYPVFVLPLPPHSMHLHLDLGRLYQHGT